MHQNQKLVQERILRALDERITPAVYSSKAPVTLRAWMAPDEPVPVAEAMRQEYVPFELGQPWGRAWSTWWFEVSGEVPAEWAGRTVELLIDPGFIGDWPGNQAECLVHTMDGVPVKGIHPRNTYVRLADEAAGGEQVRFLVEAAGNPDILVNEFVPTPYGDKATAPAEPIYRFRQAEARRVRARGVGAALRRRGAVPAADGAARDRAAPPRGAPRDRARARRAGDGRHRRHGRGRPRRGSPRCSPARPCRAPTR
ncbi:hypothetical protein WDV94_13555 [Clavibacter tessellarius]